MCKDSLVTLSTHVPLQLAWRASYDLSHKSMLRDLHHVIHFILRDSHHMIWLTFSMLRVLPHVWLRDLHHVISITCVTYISWHESRRWPRSPKWRLLRNSTAVNNIPYRYLRDVHYQDLSPKSWPAPHDLDHTTWLTSCDRHHKRRPPFSPKSFSCVTKHTKYK